MRTLFAWVFRHHMTATYDIYKKWFDSTRFQIVNYSLSFLWEVFLEKMREFYGLHSSSSEGTIHDNWDLFGPRHGVFHLRSLFAGANKT